MKRLQIWIYDDDHHDRLTNEMENAGFPVSETTEDDGETFILIDMDETNETLFRLVFGDRFHRMSYKPNTDILFERNFNISYAMTVYSNRRRAIFSATVAAASSQPPAINTSGSEQPQKRKWRNI